MDSKTTLAIDLGGTKISAAIVREGNVSTITSNKLISDVWEDEVLEQIFDITDSVLNKSVSSIGIGVPGLVDGEGIVYDVVNIPSWTNVPLKKIMEQRYGIPAIVNNDANCFALGEFHFGKGRGYDSMIGLTIGTGLGSGIIINKKLYTGNNCGAGEFGMVEYNGNITEYYASGSFFKNVHGVDGSEVYSKAVAGDASALKMYEEFGFHVGNAIKMIMYTYDVPLIVLGGSVRKGFQFFSEAMWKQVKTFGFPRSREKILIEVSELENSGLLGAAMLGEE
jgi:glucokinase